nr:2 aminoethanethiol dioxygenase [Hymenolepis microstoma]
MTTKIAKVGNLALHVFRSNFLRVASVIEDPGCLRHLLVSVSSLTLHDVGLESPFTLSPFHQVNAPVVYIHITENEVFSMGMFILRPGSRIPLHGHPGMFGVIRVMQGSMRCRSFTPLSREPGLFPIPEASNLGGTTTVMWGRALASPDLTIAEPYADKLLAATDDSPCLLTPRLGNLHELTAVDGTVVFLDILSPPYDHDLGTRECLFYREVDLPNSNVTDHQTLSQRTSKVYLTEINQPRDYWCDLLPYRGPSIS